MEPELLKTWEAFADKCEKNWNDYEKQVWEEAKASNTVSVHFLGISESVFDKLEWRGEKCSWDTFKSGNYVLVDYGDKYAEHPVSYYQTGDVFQMEYKNGNQKDYEVIGEALMPYALDYPYADFIYITVLVPEDEYITQTGNESAMYSHFVALGYDLIGAPPGVLRVKLARSDLLGSLVLDGLQLHFQGLGPFTRQDIFTLVGIVLHHLRDGLLVCQVTDDTSHRLCRLSRMFAS